MNQTRSEAPALDYDSLPQLFRAADRATSRAQRAALGLTAVRLSAAVIAALAGAFVNDVGDPKILPIMAAVAFFIALVTERQLGLAQSPHSRWYEGRALAESAKTLAWRYAVGGNPFPLTMDARAAEAEFATRLRELLGSTSAVVLDPGVDSGPQISDQMRTLRESPLQHRQDAYLTGRISTQRAWYADRARRHSHRARFWQWLMLAAEVVGAAGAILQIAGEIDQNLLGVAGAVLAAAAAWTQTRQHESLTAAYTRTFQELSVIADMAHPESDEAAWSGFIADAEEAISREHTSWRASRGASLQGGAGG